MADRGEPSLPGHPRRRRRARGRRGGRPACRDRDGPAAARALGPRPCAWRSTQLDARSVLRTLLLDELEPHAARRLRDRATLGLGDLWQLTRARPARRSSTTPWHAVTQPRLARRGRRSRDFFEVLDAAATSWSHHPYDSFATSVEAFVDQAARRPGRARDQADALPDLRRRTARSCVARARAGAGQAGGGARRAQGALRRGGQHRLGATLEEAGVHVVYGVVGLKTHAKIALVVRQEERRHPPLLPRRHRQLQPGDGPRLRGHRPAHRPTPRSRPMSPTCSTRSPATAGRRLSPAILVAPGSRCARACST